MKSHPPLGGQSYATQLEMEGFATRFVGGLGVRKGGTTGLVYMRHRWYDPQLGRFLSRDPIGYPSGLNLYEYSYSNPVSRTDESGLGELGTLLAGVTADHNTVHVSEGQQAAIGFALGFVPVLETGIGIAEFLASPSVLGAVGLLPQSRPASNLAREKALTSSINRRSSALRRLS